MSLEDRIIELEIKITRQDDLLDELNKIVYLQQKKLDQLDQLNLALVQRIKEISFNASQGGRVVDERPPHY
jgi:SlyX protein